jgi:ferritin-like metal-binding protein YciE
MEGLITEGQSFIFENAHPDVRDAGLRAAAEKMELYEIASYDLARSYAQSLGDMGAARLLQQTLEEESAAKARLTALDESAIQEQREA